MKQSERYFRQVKRHIPIGGLRKKEFLCNLQESLAAYAAKNPSALLSDYYAHFGKPEDIGHCRVVSFRNAIRRNKQQDAKRSQSIRYGNLYCLGRSDSSVFNNCAHDC